MGDVYRIDDTLGTFAFDCGGNPYSHDEYEAAVGLKEGIEGKDKERVMGALRSTIFGYIESEVTKAVK